MINRLLTLSALVSVLCLFPLPTHLSGDGAVKIKLWQSSDLQTWESVPVTPEILAEDGEIHLPAAGGSMFFRLTIEMAETQPPVPAGMVLVEGGTLSTSNELNDTEVSTFFIGRHEVTWGEWKAVRAHAAEMDYDIGGVGDGCADDHPVHTVNWYDVLKWCNLKSEMEGLTPVYTVDGATYRTGQQTHTTISQNLSASGYRLPLEAEWEFAARGGNQTNGFTYAGSNDLNAVGWYGDNSAGAACPLQTGSGTWPVGQKAANELGLYDMSGNVLEWCWDQWAGSFRLIRGGSWVSLAGSCTVSGRIVTLTDGRVFHIGFRLARSSGQ